MQIVSLDYLVLTVKDVVTLHYRGILPGKLRYIRRYILLIPPCQVSPAVRHCKGINKGSYWQFRGTQ